MRKRIPAFDVAKFIFAIHITIQHLGILKIYTLNDVENITHTFDIIDFFQNSDIVTGIFFLISSYLVFKKYYSMNEDNTVLTKYGERMLRIYAIMVLIHLPLTLQGIFYHDHLGIVDGILSFLRGTFIFGYNYYSFHLWYLLAVGYAFYGIAFLKKKKVNDTVIFSISLALLILVYIYNNAYNYTMFYRIYDSTLISIHNIFGNIRILLAPLYISMGMLIAKYNIKPKTIYTVIGLVLCIIFVRLTHFVVFGILFYLCLFLFLLSVEVKERKLYTYLGRLSKWIFLFNMIVIYIFSNITSEVNVIRILILLLFSIVFDFIYNKVTKKVSTN